MKKTTTIFILLLSLITSLSKAQTNFDLELWSSAPETPDNWSALLNPYYTTLGDTSVTKTTGQSGFAAKLSPVDLTAVGYNAGGSFLQYGATGTGEVFTSRPDSIQYYYKCNNSTLNSEIHVYLTRYNVSTTQIDTIARLDNVYTGIVNPGFVFEKQKLTYDAINGNLTPDSLKILIVTISDVATANLHTAYFAIDQIQFKGTAVNTTGLITRDNASTMKVYPTIVTSHMNFEFENSNLRFITIYDVTGKEIINEKTNNKLQTLQLSSLESGCYIYKICDRNNQPVKAGKFVVSH